MLVILHCSYEVAAVSIVMFYVCLCGSDIKSFYSEKKCLCDRCSLYHHFHFVGFYSESLIPFRTRINFHLTVKTHINLRLSRGSIVK